RKLHRWKAVNRRIRPALARVEFYESNHRPTEQHHGRCRYECKPEKSIHGYHRVCEFSDSVDEPHLPDTLSGYDDSSSRFDGRSHDPTVLAADLNGS
ncbi:MAG TPA: hypothetical protein VJ834_04520, partial [Burkholderiales bacterium]|nr:hypothetical protein [Burkholderiales bacterium]